MDSIQVVSGDHAQHYPRGFKRWHGNIKNVCAMLTTMAGLNRTFEPEK